MPLRVVFMGTPDFAVPALSAILDACHDVVAVYTRAPQPKGRGQQIQKSPIHELAETRGIPVFTPVSFKKSPEACAEFSSLRPDVAVVAAYGLILPQNVLDAPKYGCINIHASLLPRWRGASPIQQAIWARDAQSGVTIMRMESGLDTGPMIKKSTIDITSTTTTPILHDQLASAGGQLIVDVLADLERDGHVYAMSQPEDGVTYAPMLKKEDGQIDWGQDAEKIDAQIRALTPWPGTYTCLPDGQVIKILAARIAEGVTEKPIGTLQTHLGHVACGNRKMLSITAVQAPTGKKMDISALINGGYIKIGQRFSL